MTSTADSATSSSSPSMPAKAAPRSAIRPAGPAMCTWAPRGVRLGGRADAVHHVTERVLALGVDGRHLVRGQRDHDQRRLPVLGRDQRDRHRLTGHRAGHQVVADGAQRRLLRVGRLRGQGLGERVPGRQLLGAGRAAVGLEDDEGGQCAGIVEGRCGIGCLHRFGRARQERLLVVGLHGGQRPDGRAAEAGDGQPGDHHGDQPDGPQHRLSPRRRRRRLRWRWRWRWRWR